MCGFTAIVGGDGALLEASLNKMLYRGLNSESYLHKGRVHVGHTRLPIVELSEKGNQPVHLEGRTGFLVGEVFNFKELYPHAVTDTQAILECFVREGLEGFHKLDGFWTFITVIDDNLLVVNDYLSQKPVYYRTDMLAIASEPNALLAYGDSPFDEVFFSNTLKWGYDPTGRTPWENIKQLPPGHYWLNGDIKPYWDWSKVEVNHDLYTALQKATANRLLGDRPIACLLSGGLDSSIVYALCKENEVDVETFHVDNDEAEYAKLVDPKVKALDLTDVTYEEAITAHQSSVDLGSVLPQTVLAKAVQKAGYHVCLTGDGADELFGGYNRAKDYDSQASDVFVELPYYHLPRLDRIMMRSTIEIRTPFLAPEVVRIAMGTKRELRTDKKILKDLFTYHLPLEVIERPKKALKIPLLRSGLQHSLIEANIKLFKEIYK